jgi:hypothetical protein
MGAGIATTAWSVRDMLFAADQQLAEDVGLAS